MRHAQASDEGAVIRKVLLGAGVLPEDIEDTPPPSSMDPTNLPAGHAARRLVCLTPGGFALPEGLVIHAEQDRWVRGRNGSELLPDGWVVEKHEPYRVTEIGWRTTLERAAQLAAQEIRLARCRKAYVID